MPCIDSLPTTRPVPARLSRSCGELKSSWCTSSRPCYRLFSYMKILVVEDDFDARDLLQVMLGLDGHEVVCAVNGEDGWAKFQDDHFSVVISDWLMPETDGIELCQRIRSSETTRYSYFILLTALQGKSNYLEAMH